ncbi:hypothetical protein ACOSP7_001078 [Xanthoceras sorbifolium]
MLVEIGLCLVALLVVFISYFVHAWSNPKSNGKLPPGSMGLPIIGETLHFFSSHSLYEVSPFFKKRMNRYGPMFKTSLFAQKMVVSTDPDINYKLFQQENQNLLFWFSGSFTKMIGEEKLLAGHGSIHKYVKNLLLHFVGAENLKAKLLPEMDIATQRRLQIWARHGSVDVKDDCGQMIFESFAKRLISYDTANDTMKLGANLKAFMDGLISFPLNIPGTAFHASMQGHKRSMKAMQDIYNERKASKVSKNDFLDHLLEEMKKENTFLDESNAVKLLYGILFAAFEATSQAITLVTKFLCEQPDVLAELTKEHEELLKRRVDENSPFTWEEYKSLTFTHMVINETIRLGNIAPGIFRKVVKDLEINGYTIPAGWIFMAALPVVHLSSDKYENPFTFNPWRWQGKELNSGSKNFMGFGIGVRLCVGAEYAKLQVALYLHYLITKYRWSLIKGGDVVKKPVNMFPNGLHIKIAEK